MSFSPSEFFICQRGQLHQQTLFSSTLQTPVPAKSFIHFTENQSTWVTTWVTPWSSLTLKHFSGVAENEELGPRAPSQQILQLQHSNLSSHLLTRPHTQTRFAPQLLQIKQLWPQSEDFSLLARYFPLNIHKLFQDKTETTETWWTARLLIFALLVAGTLTVLNSILWSSMLSRIKNSI